MKLTGIQDVGLIKAFDTIELPSFSVLIGPNGVGKSQFLRAIANGGIRVGDETGPGIAMPPSGGAVLIANADPLPASGRSASTSSNATGQSTTLAMANPMVQTVGQQKARVTNRILSDLADQVGVARTDIEAIDEDPWSLGPDALAQRLGIEAGSPATDAIKLAFDRADAALVSDSRSDPRYVDPALSLLQSLAMRLKVPPTSVSKRMMAENSVIGTFGIFDPNVDAVIAFYRDRVSNNHLAGLNGSPSLDKTAFEAAYGPSPWSLIDEALKDFGLPYSVVRPKFEAPPPPYTLSFQRTDTASPIEPQHTSSGEKVLLRFALAMLPYDPLRVVLTQPKLLLLDEMDASLHPQMLARWLETLRDEFVGKREMDCILTTHSPITVALAPEESIFELADGDPVPRRISKQQALNRLTVGLPTLAIDYSGQRQVFVESDTDAAIFTSIMATLKKPLGLQRSLSFISTGFRTKANVEQNAGYEVVASVSQALRKSGNKSVFGLVDWDGVRTSGSSVKVLAEGSHYTLENLLLDPLLIGALLMRDSDLTLVEDENFATLAKMNQAVLQRVADFVQSDLNYPADAPSGQQTVSYLGAPNIQVRSAFTRTPGHDLEPLLAKAFPYLRQFAANRGTMVKEVVARVLPLYPILCPLPIVATFSLISDQEN